jgi:hypothetical protein
MARKLGTQIPANEILRRKLEILFDNLRIFKFDIISKELQFCKGNQRFFLNILNFFLVFRFFFLQRNICERKLENPFY